MYKLPSSSVLLHYPPITSFTYSRICPPFPHPLATTPGLPQAGSRAGPGPRRGGLIGDHAGGTLRGRPPQRPARALPRTGPHAPNLRRATEGCGWVGKQPAGSARRLMRDCSDGVECPPLKGGVGENPHQLSKAPLSRHGRGDASRFA